MVHETLSKVVMTNVGLRTYRSNLEKDIYGRPQSAFGFSTENKRDVTNRIRNELAEFHLGFEFVASQCHVVAHFDMA